jgi:hypothetical protein
VLNNCTLSGNSQGAVDCLLTNCIVYFNSWMNYDSSSALDHCCTTPLPANGVGNISSDPQLASAFYLSALSPCIGKGKFAAVSGTDIDGEPWANPPAIGCDEYHAGAVTGPLTVDFTASLTNVIVGYSVDLTASIEGRTDLSIWEFGDGALEINQPYTTHSWSAVGDYPVSLWVFNDSYPAGIRAAVTVHVGTGLHYVAANSANPVAPYTSWTTAATNIQDAINAAEPGAQVVVTNGTYAPITANGYLSVRSVNGAPFTIIDAGQSGSCALLGDATTLSGFTLTNGFALFGGGVLGSSSMAVVSNCVITGNQAYGPLGQAHGGGAAYCTLNNCALIGNGAHATNYFFPWLVTNVSGGGAYMCAMHNCNLLGNSAGLNGGGASDCALNNCTLSSNSVANYGGGAYHCTLSNCILSGNSAANSGGGSCVSTLSGSTLTGNSATNYGGGDTSSTLYNCALTGNSANYGGGEATSTLYNCALTGNAGTLIGGGAYGGTLNNCALTGNSAPNGGGADGATLTNCTLTQNVATGVGGGVFTGSLVNCIVYSNLAPTGANYFSSVITHASYCCTTPQPANGVGNITNAPLFVDQVGGNLRLQSNSPCINAGNNAFAPAGTDLDGNPRIKGATVDIGAYEFQSPASRISYAWLQQYGLPTDGSADFADPDHDGLNNWQEWRCGTDPTNALSVLRLLPPVRTGTNVTLTWQSAAGMNYFLLRSTNLAASPVFVPLATDVFGQAGTTSFTDTSAAGAGPFFYRVGVGN